MDEDDRGPADVDAHKIMIEINFIWIYHAIRAWLDKPKGD